MHAFIKVEDFGVHVKVWTFQHLTIPEYMAAVSICNNLWRKQCYIIRYFTTSSKLLAIYKMVIRFVSGILMHDAGFIASVLCRHVLPVPLSLHNAPMHYQLYSGTTVLMVQTGRNSLNNSFSYAQSFLKQTRNSILSTSLFFKRFPILSVSVSLTPFLQTNGIA